MPLKSGLSQGVLALSANGRISDIRSTLSKGNVFDIFSKINTKKLAVNLSYYPTEVFYNFNLEYDLKPDLSCSCNIPVDSKVLNIALISPFEDNLLFIPTGFSVFDTGSPSGTITIPYGIYHAFNPTYNIISLATNEQRRFTMSIAIKRDVDPSEITQFEKYLNYFNLYISDNNSTVSNDFINNNNATISTVRLIGFTQNEFKEMSTVPYWEVIAPANLKEISLPEIPEPHHGIEDIIANSDEDESVKFIQLFYTLEERMSMEEFTIEGFYNTVTHVSWSEEKIKSGRED